MGGFALRVLVCGSDRECGALRDIASTLPDIDLTTWSDVRVPDEIIHPAGGQQSASEAVIISRAWLSTSGAPAISEMLAGDDGLCLVVAGGPDLARCPTTAIAAARPCRRR